MEEKRTKLQKYIDFKLGRGEELEQLKVMVKKSFQAASFRQFWQYWNPVYSYFLAKYIYKPVKGMLPDSLAVLLTFTASGFLLHDLPIMIFVFSITGKLLSFPVTIYFLLLGLTVIIGEQFSLRFDNINSKKRILIHTGVLIGLFLVSMLIQFRI